MLAIIRADSQLLNPSGRFASLLWDSDGGGDFSHGKNRGGLIPMLGGLLMIAVASLVSDWRLMSRLNIAVMVAVYWLMNQGH